MKFRISVQPKRNRQELKSVAPTLLSDPAFSPDPHTNPYFVTGQPAWASSPPVGHPTLKNKNRIQPSNFAQPVTGTDLDFHLVQPPNSPVAPSATPNPRLFSSTAPVTNLRPPSPPSPPAVKGRMPFFSRRKSSQPAPPVRSSTILGLNKAPNFNDVTQPPEQRPIPGPRYLSEPVKNVDSRPNPPRRAATTGASTPRSTTTATTTGSTAPSARNQDLDRIDELDETNPWGVSLHHGGPYEAAVQAIRRAGNTVPLGFNVNLNDYPRQAMHAHGNLYVPPQVPPGVSLNLSPGQILPRNFHLQNGYYADAPAAPHPQMMKPPGFSPGQPRSRHVSQPLPTASPLPNPHPILQKEPRISSGPPSSRHLSQQLLQTPSLLNPRPIMQMEPRFSPAPPSSRHLSQPLPSASPLPNPRPTIQVKPRDPSPNREPEAEKPLDDLSFNIGMAMLQPEASETSNPSILLHSKTSDEKEFDPYDPIHLENRHSRTPSPLVNSPPERSRGPSPDPMAQSLTPEPTTFGNSGKGGHSPLSSSLEGRPEPPPYTSPTPIPLNHQHLQPLFPVQTPDQSRASSRNPSPRPSSFTESAGNSGSPPRSRENPRQEMIVGMDSPLQNAPSIPPIQQTVGLDRQMQNVPSMPPIQHTAHQNIQLVAPVPATRISREYLPNPGPPSMQDRADGRSTHHSISTFSSNQSRNGGQAPPHRRVPKHLVMPAPLNNNPNIGMHQPQTRIQQLPSASPFSPVKVQVQVRAEPLAYPQAPPLRTPMQRPVGTPVRAQEIQIAAARKLRKRVSTITPPTVGNIPSAPIVTTVSFAAPVIGFNNSPSNEKAIGRSRTEKIPKRVLSKRRTDF